jgi:hypothetical protein
MKKPAFLATALLALAAAVHAVPTEINYQGVLTDQNGNPVNGVRAMQIKIYDAPTGGTLLYSEDLGNVPVQDGIYSFSFGANGTSNALTTETVAIANGTVSTFQKVLAAPTVVAGSVTVTDGTYTWDQTNGSSNENDFSVAYSPNLRRVTVTYYNGAPAAGKIITATYRSPNAGITGSLADIGNAWSEVSIGGTPQNPRQKILSVPFAINAMNVASISSIRSFKSEIELNAHEQDIKDWGIGTLREEAPSTVSFPVENPSGYRKLLEWKVPDYVQEIHYLELEILTFTGRFGYNPTTHGTLIVWYKKGSSFTSIETKLTNYSTKQKVKIYLNEKIKFGETVKIYFDLTPGSYPGYGSGVTLFSANLKCIANEIFPW